MTKTEAHNIIDNFDIANYFHATELPIEKIQSINADYYDIMHYAITNLPADIVITQDFMANLSFLALDAVIDGF